MALGHKMPRRSAVDHVRNTSSQLFPSRHSRHGPAPTCLSSSQLSEMTMEILESKPGSLYTYQYATTKESARAWDAANVAVQKTEFLLRGYAARVPNSVYHKIFSEQLSAAEEGTNCVEMMQRLVNRLDEEGQLYMKLRHEVKTQRTREEMGSSVQYDKYSEHALSDPKSDSDEADEALQASKEAQQNDVNSEEDNDLPVDFTFASPGPTVAMFDTILDAMAVSPNEQTPQNVGTMLEYAMQRYQLDGGTENVNVLTVPTCMTFNGALRAVANSPNASMKTRDDALMYAFATYDAMREVVPRNAATYKYMLDTVAKFLPPCRTRGNIAHGLWIQARKEFVVDQGVIDAFRGAHQPSNGKEYDSWMQEYMKADIPIKFRRNARGRRHDKRFATY